MSRSTLRRALGAGALCLTATTTAALVPAIADAAEVGVSAKRLNIQSGSRVTVKGRVAAPGTVKLQIQRRGRWVTLDRDRTELRGTLRPAQARPRRRRARARVRTNAGATRVVGRLNVYRQRAGLVVRPGPVRQPARVAAAGSATAPSASPTSRCRAARKRDDPPSRAGRARARDRPRPVRRRPRVRPDGRDRAQAALQRPRPDPGHPLGDANVRASGATPYHRSEWPRSA